VTTNAKAGRREWIGLSVLALACLLYSMDLTVLYLALPSLSADLRPTSTQLLWISDIYGFMVAGFLITMGTLGDRIGRRRLLMIGAAAFGVASVVAAFSSSAEMLIATRAVLGIAGATLAPSTLSLIRSMFHDPDQRRTAIGVWITSFSVGGAIGPLLGGVMIERFWWGSVFLLAVPVMALLLVLGPIVLTEYRDPNAGKPDPPSALLSLGAVLSIIYGLKQIAGEGVGWQPIAFILFGLAIGGVFVRRQRRLADPMIDLRLFRLPAFTTALGAYMLGVLGAFGLFLFTAQYLQLVLGLSPLTAGLWSLPSSAAFIVGSMTAPVLVKHVRHAYLMAGGLAVGAVGIGMLTQITSSDLALLVAGSTIMAIGLAPVFTLTTDVIIGTAPPERAGAASGISETAAEFGGALGIAILGSIGTAVYRAAMHDAIPAGVSPEGAAAARATLGGAVDVAGQLAGAAGSALLDAAREAFTQAMRTAAAVAAAVLAVTAAACAVALRNVRPGTEHDGSPPDDAAVPAAA
jgi:DHA2 family multidrug resistance protein-like MFS transporter